MAFAMDDEGLPGMKLIDECDGYSNLEKLQTKKLFLLFEYYHILYTKS